VGLGLALVVLTGLAAFIGGLQGRFGADLIEEQLLHDLVVRELGLDAARDLGEGDGTLKR
jgi:hypothetical protein